MAWRTIADVNEASIHRAVVSHLHARGVPGLLWWHCPNDAKRGPGTYRRLQQMGLLAGVADLVFLHDGRFYALELKSESGRPTEAQLEFRDNVLAAGGYAAIVNGLDRALLVLEMWGLLRGQR